MAGIGTYQASPSVITGEVTAIPGEPVLLGTYSATTAATAITDANKYQYILVKYRSTNASPTSGILFSPDFTIPNPVLLPYYRLMTYAQNAISTSFIPGYLQTGYTGYVSDSFVYAGSNRVGYLLFVNTSESALYILTSQTNTVFEVYGVNWYIDGWVPKNEGASAETIQPYLAVGAVASTMTQVPSASCRKINIINDTGATLRINQNGTFASTSYVTIANGIGMSFICQSNANEYYIGRDDGSASAINVKYTTQNTLQ